MKVLWTLVKVALGLALVVPIAIIVLATALGLLGALLGLAVLTLKLAVVGLIAWGIFRVGVALLGGRKQPAPPKLKELPPVDPYYEAAKRELDRELAG